MLTPFHIPGYWASTQTPQFLSEWPQQLSRGVPQTWFCSLSEKDISDIEKTQPKLHPSELERFERFPQALPKAIFAHSRQVLRFLLGHYLEVSPDTLQFTLNENGKPELSDLAVSQKSLHFNLSHSGPHYALSLCLKSRVGVDIEGIRSLTQLQRVAERFYTPEEQAALQHAQKNQLNQKFFEIWTAKEALIKAKGLGVFGHFEEAALSLQDTPQPLDPFWRLQALQLPEGLLGHVAYESH